MTAKERLVEIIIKERIEKDNGFVGDIGLIEKLADSILKEFVRIEDLKKQVEELERRSDENR